MQTILGNEATIFYLWVSLGEVKASISSVLGADNDKLLTEERKVKKAMEIAL